MIFVHSDETICMLRFHSNCFQLQCNNKISKNLVLSNIVRLSCSRNSKASKIVSERSKNSFSSDLKRSFPLQNISGPAFKLSQLASIYDSVGLKGSVWLDASGSFSLLKFKGSSFDPINSTGWLTVKWVWLATEKHVIHLKLQRFTISYVSLSPIIRPRLF